MFDLVKLSETADYAEIAGVDPDDIRRFTPHARFQAIANMKRQLLKECPAPKNNPNQPVPEDKFEKEITALIRISKTMRHTEAYLEWLNHCRNFLTARLYADKAYMYYIQNWNSISIDDRKNALRIREKHHSIVAKETSGLNYKSTHITFREIAPYDDIIPGQQNIINGYFTSDIDLITQTRSIHQNVHLRSSFRCASKANGDNHHEKKHDLGAQGGFMFINNVNLGCYKDDGELWYHMLARKAIIPSRIHSAYRAQFHEVVGYEEGHKMAKLTEAMIKPCFTSSNNYPLQYVAA